MAFKNEKVLPLEKETSEFFRKAQKTLNVMCERRNTWTIDREREMALVYKGGGHDMDSKDDESWSFIDRQGKYFIYTTKLSESETLSDEIAITRSFRWMIGGGSIVPDAETIACIKQALVNIKTMVLFQTTSAVISL